MDVRLPPHGGAKLSVVDMHAGGEPLRIIVSGYPEVKGHTLLSKRRYARQHLDHLRRALMLEPRGHGDMYGALPVASELPDAHLGVLFMHNEGYSTMCGHAVMALGRFAVDYGLVKEPRSPETPVNIHCPCGLVRAFVEYADGKTGAVRFLSVPAFVFATDVTVAVEGFGDVTVDISYGGAFYAIVDARRFGLDVSESRTRDLADAATAVTKAVKSQVKLRHPLSDDLAFLYGTILTDGKEEFSSSDATANVCVFAEAQPDGIRRDGASGPPVPQGSDPVETVQDLPERGHRIAVHRQSRRGDHVRRLQGGGGGSGRRSFLHGGVLFGAGDGGPAERRLCAQVSRSLGAFSSSPL
ncbi:trans-L-3-hydroxyproline dehydratase isoform X3 [Hippocampus zosterae]|nr:trans-L-3-hydroxyproline dehydratase isoform X3 [Hippocampus zosterae]